MSHHTVIIVGAGIAGLLCARDLAEAGVDVALVDKGFLPGGRMATRRIDDATFDHGAQFLTAKTPEFAALVDELQAAGVVAPWFTGSPDPGGDGEHPRFRGAPYMRAICEHLADGRDVACSRRVEAALVDGGRWELRYDGDTEPSTADVLVLTPPVPQSLAILDAGATAIHPGTREILEAIAYDPAIALLATASGPTRLPNNGALRVGTEPIEWLADNHAKGISDAPSVTVHLGPATSRLRWAEPDEALTDVLDAAAEICGVDLELVRVQRWRYSAPTSTAPSAALVSSEPAPVVFAGDGLAGGRVEGAARSGRAAAAEVLTLLS